MKVGTIGTSFITKCFLERVAMIDGITVEAIYSRTYEKANELAEEFGVKKIYTGM